MKHLREKYRDYDIQTYIHIYIIMEESEPLYDSNCDDDDDELGSVALYTLLLSTELTDVVVVLSDPLVGWSTDG